jgi:pimeloyl-ACP methyl ester carboxylesterase
VNLIFLHGKIWWGDALGPRGMPDSESGTKGELIIGNIFYKPFLTSLSKKINPVIVVPGIMGSAYKNGVLVLDPILHVYDDLVDTLSANGYQENKTLFPFPYEWRDSNVFTALLLKTKIDEAKTKCKESKIENTSCDKVDIVAHSMGGLVARQYIESGHYEDDVDELIFLGTPHKGSPKSYLQWEAGEFEDNFSQFLQKKFFEIEARKNGYKSLFDYIHERPITSVEELLPIFNYIKDKNTDTTREYPQNYPQNIFLEK